MEKLTIRTLGNELPEIRHRRDEAEEDKRRKGGFFAPGLNAGSAARFATGSLAAQSEPTQASILAKFVASMGSLGGFPILASVAGLMLLGSAAVLWSSRSGPELKQYSMDGGSARGGAESPAPLTGASNASLDMLKYSNDRSGAQIGYEMTGNPSASAQSPSSEAVPPEATAVAQAAVPPLPQGETQASAPLDKARDALASQASSAIGKLSNQIGSGARVLGGMGAARLGNINPGVGSQGIGQGFQAMNLKSKAHGNLARLRKAAIQPVARAGRTSPLGNRAFGQLKQIAGSKPQYANSKGAVFEKGSEPFDRGGVSGPAGLSDNGPGVVGTPSASNGGSAGGSGTGPNPLADPGGNETKNAPAENMSMAQGLMMIGFIVLAIAALLAFIARKVDPATGEILRTISRILGGVAAGIGASVIAIGAGLGGMGQQSASGGYIAAGAVMVIAGILIALQPELAESSQADAAGNVKGVVEPHQYPDAWLDNGTRYV